ncbi:MAG TPA: molybdenum cofactor guanylyltransferase [Candidatus Krumholzibacteria bacterium]|nr:molybdenum cofactor guanylyltransferase [Candidatus Krumholzibacteria bacterium]HPD70261.1 molybdenum cofactor guanylyltransferase [Candidatus Krumholzibacteria bacterium]HRY40039.1 molybdenum cofactor guanylyltransferase [Candidatus Krumholzibacteria bacterium]
MIPCPRVLLIGAAHRNAGKTEFACEVIRRQAAARRVVGVKVTTISEREGLCPRGGEGCGVCGSLTGEFCVTEELRPDLAKDTSRLLRAGAAQVLWLRVRQPHLAEGLTATLARIPPDALIVCESNSARRVIEPGLFLVLRRADDPSLKPSSATVAHLADRVVRFHGDRWDLAPDRVVPAGDRWVLQPEATAVILAGGESRRMGTDKSLCDAGGRPLIAHIAAQLDYFPERLIGASAADRFAFLGLPVVPDREPGRGPLMGILSCVERAAYDLSFVTACDIPHLDSAFVLGLLAQAGEVDIVLPRLPDGRTEPLLAVYRKTIIPAAEAALRDGQRRIVSLLDHVRVRFVPFGPPAWYRNLNSPHDLATWRRDLAGPSESA